MRLTAQFTNSLYNFKAYGALARIRGGKSFLYIFLIFTLSYAIFTINAGVRTHQVLTQVQQAIQADVPDFRLEDGRFFFAGPQPYRVEEEGFVFIIDTTGETVREDLAGVLSGLLITETELITVSGGRMEIFPFDQVPITITKDQVIEFIPNITGLLYIALAIWYFFAFGGKLFGILILALIGMIAAGIFNQKLTFGQLWNIAIYASTLPILVKAFHAVAGYPLAGWFFILYWALAITYVFLGIHAMSQDTEDRNAMDPQTVL